MLAAVSVLVASASCFAAVQHPNLARRAYLHAVELQQKLEAQPAGSRTRAEYKRVIREFRNVYFYDFAYVKAPVAAEAMGDLYTEMGKRFSSPAYFRAAIKAYRYVISQYPACSMARTAWLSMGRVYLDGLNDPRRAADTFQSFLEKHPSSAQSSEARKSLKEIADRAATAKQNRSAGAEAADISHEHVQGGPVMVTEIHDWVGPNYTRVVIGAKGPFKYNTLRLSHPERIVFDLPNTHLDRALLKKEVALKGDFLRGIRIGQFKPNVTRVVLDVKNVEDYSAFPLPNPFRLIIDVHGSSPRTARNEPQQRKPFPRAAREAAHSRAVQASVQQHAAAAKNPASPEEAAETEADKLIEEAAGPKTEAASGRDKPLPGEHQAEVAFGHPIQRPVNRKSEAAPDKHVSRTARKKTELASIKPEPREIPVSTRPASPTEDGSQTLTRALGLKVERIVIDPGHGGFDTGTIGPTGLEEKNVVLDVALRLRKLFETRTDAQVFMTRSTDKFIPLEERTAIANEKDADLFISIHANASPDHRVRGIATYFLNFTTDPEALNVAARENATSQESVHQLQGLIKKIALNNKIEESRELARDIQTVLYRRMSRVSHGIHNRGVRKAPFVVLIGANMPSVLAEISFVSNPRSEHLLREPSYREDIAKALFSGIEDYINNLGSVRVAQRTQ